MKSMKSMKSFSREAHTEEGAPAVRVRYFYTSPLAIDDPLSAVPPPTLSTSAPLRHAPRPFSKYDNRLLNEAWEKVRKQRKITRANEEVEKRNATEEARRRDSLVESAPLTSRDGRRGDSANLSSIEYRFRSLRIPKTNGQGGSSAVSNNITNPSSSFADGRSTDTDRPRASSIAWRVYGDESQAASLSGSLDSHSYRDDGSILDGDTGGITGTPFIRAPSRTKVQTSKRYEHMASASRPSSQGSVKSEKAGEDVGRGLSQVSEATATVAVGVSRLHQVLLPQLSMEPIYWRPVNDIADVIRGTWFYKDCMLPVEPDVANMLETGYLHLRPWTETWKDELESAVEVGAAGEEKIVHNLWPNPHRQRQKSDVRPDSAMSHAAVDVEEETPEAKRKVLVQAAESDIEKANQAQNNDTKASGSILYGRDGQRRLYLGSSVIYANGKEAYILRPSLQPSSYYGRRPLANYVRKGRDIGIPVVRGFDQRVYDRLNPQKSDSKAMRAQEGVSSSQADAERLRSDPSLAKSNSAMVTDLVLVIHGIGQKLSERVESYHFTHAMNSFRREVNVELGTNNVKTHLRKEMGGIMVLPVNWRATLSLEEGGYKSGPGDSASGMNQYGLKDITPESLPSIRNIISDVMLDIPYYLSHHQPKMISAVLREANRVHRLWCSNNPGFEKYGRVHIIAHSLGSVMAVDILSDQPTEIEDPEDTAEDPDPEHFAFDTTNLYLCGSPAGFFLLLKKAGLLPRKGRSKPSSDGDDMTPGVAGEQGTYGCLAVDNVYNVVNPYDPVAYRVNATIDATYAASLKTAYVPSASSSWFTNPFKGTSSTATGVTPAAVRPTLLASMPSQVELDTHNFSREELAEKRAYLLNDNGQIDFFLRYGGGPLEIQYLTMLGAHSSYWLSKDFVRFVVVEAGRELGKKGTLDVMRAVKKKAVTV